MGGRQSDLKPKEISDLSKLTQFSEKEVKECHDMFMNEVPNGYFTIEDFKKFYTQFFPKAEPEDTHEFAAHVFRTFDVNRDGKVNFQEFIAGISVNTDSRTIEEQLQWAFAMFDKDSNGYVSYNEMLQIVTAIYKAKGGLTMVNKDGSKPLIEYTCTPETLTEEMFKNLDKDSDGQLSFPEFVKGAQKDPLFLKLLSF